MCAASGNARSHLAAKGSSFCPPSKAPLRRGCACSRQSAKRAQHTLGSLCRWPGPCPACPQSSLCRPSSCPVLLPGTKSIKYLEENVGALQVVLTPEEVAELEAAVPQDQVGLNLGFRRG